MSVSIIDDGGIALINALVTQLNNLIADVSALRTAYAAGQAGGFTVTTGSVVAATSVVAQKIVPFK